MAATILGQKTFRGNILFDGYVAIGTDSPLGELDIVGDTVIHANSTDESDFLLLKHDGTDGYIYSASGSIRIDGYTSINDGASIHGEFGVSGDATVSGRLLAGNGLAASPSIAFYNDDDGSGTGFYLAASNQPAMSANGTVVWEAVSTFWQMAASGAPRLSNGAGTTTTPNVIPSNQDTNTGISRPAADQLSLIAGGKEIARAYENTVEQLILNPQADYAGTAAAPSLAFGDGDTGFYESSDDSLSVIAGGIEGVRVAPAGDGYVTSEFKGQTWSAVANTATPAGTTETLNLNASNSFVIDLESATGDVTVTLSNPEAGASYIVKIAQSSTTARDIIWPATVLFPGGVTPVISAGANAVDIVTLFWSGANYYANVGQDYS